MSAAIRKPATVLSLALEAAKREHARRVGLPEEDWQIDIRDNGAMRGTCPKCGSWDVSYIGAPSVMECCACGHTSRSVG